MTYASTPPVSSRNTTAAQVLERLANHRRDLAVLFLRHLQDAHQEPDISGNRPVGRGSDRSAGTVHPENLVRGDLLVEGEVYLVPLRKRDLGLLSISDRTDARWGPPRGTPRPP